MNTLVPMIVWGLLVLVLLSYAWDCITYCMTGTSPMTRRKK